AGRAKGRQGGAGGAGGTGGPGGAARRWRGGTSDRGPAGAPRSRSDIARALGGTDIGSFSASCPRQRRCPLTRIETAMTYTAADWQALQGGIAGDVILPGSPDYELVPRPAMARLANIRPRAVVRCRTAADGSATIAFARRTLG